jgi:hypothetical protein
MAENKDSKELSHNAYALKRETRVSDRWLDAGNARFKFDIARLPDNLKHLIPHLPELLKALQGYVFLDRTPPRRVQRRGLSCADRREAGRTQSTTATPYEPARRRRGRILTWHTSRRLGTSLRTRSFLIIAHQFRSIVRFG